MKKICKVCQQYFYVPKCREQTALYCSCDCQHQGQKHSRKKPKIKKICLFCHKQFEVTPYLRAKQCCNISCSRKYLWNQSEFRQNIINKLKGKHNSPKTEFKRGKHYNSTTEFKKEEHCSPETEFKKGKKHRYFEIPEKNHPAFKHGKTNKTYYCQDCGKKVSNFRAKRCSKCNGKIISKMISGRKNGMYINGKSKEPYPLGWTNTFREQIRDRDNHTCQKCGMAEDYYRKLDVHHIDYNKENLDLNNLIALCHRCHVKTNYNRDYWYAYYVYVMENQ